MNEKEFRSFCKLVRMMRDQQKLYFKTRSGQILQRSKELEKQVDSQLNEISDNKVQQQLNFD